MKVQPIISTPSRTRRALLRDLAASTALIAIGPTPLSYARKVWSAGDPFSLGVASGAPSADGFVLWTRLAPEPLSQDPGAPGGMRGGAVPVRYEIATDETMHSIVRRGEASALPLYAYSVHVEVSGLLPGRVYWYRFITGEAVSRIGRALTAPAPGAALDALRFGFVSCSNYEHGYFSAYRHLADEHPDLVIFLGDYIYEYVDLRSGTVRKHSDGVAAATLPTYRNRYAQYRLDADLQRLHAEVPALMTWDDHEVQNDYANEWSETFDDPKEFLKRRAAAYQAYYEHMPVRPSVSRPNGPSMRVYDRYRFGTLADVLLLDGRQYRSREACYARPNRGGAHMEIPSSCPELMDRERSMLGREQEDWLFQQFDRSNAGWNVIAQDVLMAQLARKTPNGESAFWTDDWSGYPASRNRLIEHLHSSRVANPVVIGGDIHSYWTNDLKLDFNDRNSPIVATEFVGTSVSAHPPPPDAFSNYLKDNPHVRYFEDRWRGYVSVDLTPRQMTTRYRAISDAANAAATVSTLKSFVVTAGQPGAVAT